MNANISKKTDTAINTSTQIIDTINSHNNLVFFFKECNDPVPFNKFFKGMEMWHRLSLAGNSIVRMARSMGVNVKCDSQSGEIIFYNDTFLHEIEFEFGDAMCVKSSSEKLSVETATAFLASDIRKYGKIVRIAPISEQEARKFFDLSGLTHWPLIG